MPLQPQTGWYKSGHGIFGILLLFMQSLPKLGLGVSGAAVLLCSPCGGTGVAGIFTFWLLGWLLFSLLLVVVCLVMFLFGLNASSCSSSWVSCSGRCWRSISAGP